MDNQGWIRLHRTLMDKAIWQESTPEQKTILITLLMMANHQEAEWEWKGDRYKAEPGQFVTSLESIVKKSGNGVSVRNVRTALKRFEKYGFLTNKSTNKNRLITIVNWGFYQGKEEEVTSKVTGNRQASDKQVTTNKNDNNNKNEKKDNIYIAAIFDYWIEKKIINHRSLSQKMKSSINARLKDYSPEEIKDAIDNYSIIINSEDYFFDYRWTLDKFMEQKNFERFVSESKPFDAFKRNTNNRNKPVDWDALDKHFDLED